MKRVRLAAWWMIGGLAVGGCGAKPPLALHGNGVKSIALSPQVRVPDSFSYTDTTASSMEAAGAAGGLFGALIGGAIGATSAGVGRGRFAAVAEQCGVDVGAELLAVARSLIETGGGLRLEPSGKDGTLTLEILNWGVQPGGYGCLTTSLTAKGRLTAPNGKVTWSRTATATGGVPHKTEELFNNPAIFAEELHVAIRVAANKLLVSDAPTAPGGFTAGRDPVPPTAPSMAPVGPAGSLAASNP